MEISFKDIHDAILNESKNGVPFPYEMKPKIKPLKEKIVRVKKLKPLKIPKVKKELIVKKIVQPEKSIPVIESEPEKRKKRQKIKRDISTEQAKDLILEKKKAGCSNCGYNRYTGALEFHHIDPSTKSFAVGKGAGKNLNEILEELSKCVLLCSNCHREVHGGLIKL